MGDDIDGNVDDESAHDHRADAGGGRDSDTDPTRESVSLVGSATREEIYADEFSTAGSATVSGDVDAVVADLKGSTTVHGDLRARELSAAGSTTIDGDATVSSWSSSGSTRLAGDLSAESLSTAGSFRIDGETTAEEASFSGSATLADLRARSVTAAGSLTVEDVLADRIDVAGAVQGDDLAGTEVDIRLGGAESAVDRIEAERVTIRPGEDVVSLPDLDLGGFGEWIGELVSRFGSVEPGDARLTADRIEGDTVELEAVTADVVVGETVSLGPDCAIGTLDATELERHDDATVERFEQPEPTP